MIVFWSKQHPAGFGIDSIIHQGKRHEVTCEEGYPMFKGLNLLTFNNAYLTVCRAIKLSEHGELTPLWQNFWK